MTTQVRGNAVVGAKVAYTDQANPRTVYEVISVPVNDSPGYYGLREDGSDSPIATNFSDLRQPGWTFVERTAEEAYVEHLAHVINYLEAIKRGVEFHSLRFDDSGKRDWGMAGDMAAADANLRHVAQSMGMAQCDDCGEFLSATDEGYLHETGPCAGPEDPTDEEDES